jgi:hypothetical protein
MLIPNKMNFKTKLVTRDKNGYCVMIKWEWRSYNNYKYVYI